MLKIVNFTSELQNLNTRRLGGRRIQTSKNWSVQFYADVSQPRRAWSLWAVLGAQVTKAAGWVEGPGSACHIPFHKDIDCELQAFRLEIVFTC